MTEQAATTPATATAPSEDLAWTHKMRGLKSKLSSLYKEIQAIHNDAKAAEKDINLFSAFRGKYKVLDIIHNDFLRVWEELYESFGSKGREKDFPCEEKVKTAAKNYVYECHAVYETVMHPIPPPPSPPRALNVAIAPDASANPFQDTSAVSFARARLPKIRIPSFHGDILLWPQFRDVFLSLVHEEPALSSIEKFHHLVGCLTGEPLQLVSAFPLVATNYDAAWKALNERFNNKRILAATYMNRVQQFKPMGQQTNSLTHLRSFLKCVGESFSALQALKISDEADFFKLYLGLQCLDVETRQLFEESQKEEEFPTYASLIKFIQQRCQVLELSASSTPARSAPSKHSMSSSGRPKVLNAIGEDAISGQCQPNSQSSTRYCCPKCKQGHLLFRCFAFLRLLPSEKLEFVRKNGVCFNCLRQGHVAPKCPSNRRCNLCDRNHHSHLHQALMQNTSNKGSATSAETTSSPPSGPKYTKETPDGLVGAVVDSKSILLGTAMVQMKDWRGDFQTVRIVIDSGSQYSIITADCAQRLGLTWLPIKRTVSGVGNVKLTTAKGLVNCQIRSSVGEVREVQTRALILPTITSNLPTVSLSPTLRSHFDSVELADSAFWDARPIDFLLGSDLFIQILLPDPMIQVSDKFGTLSTIFGHVVIGIPPEDSMGTCLAVTASPLSDSTMRDFWLIEEALPSEHTHPDEAICETHYRETVSRLPTGRYMVALPLRNPDQRYPAAKYLAMKRFRNLESRLDRDADLKQKYDEFMRDYISLNHMQETSTESAYVIPHHAVLKPESSTSEELKLRVVFDASMRTAAGSLNDNLFIGPKLQQEITTIILNFRAHRIAFCTDIVKMFRQILIRPEDRCFQHILWRFSQEEPIKTFELSTVTYGLASSPYLALRVLRQLAEEDGKNYPEAAKVLTNDVYVDDVITGADSLNEALQLKEHIISLLRGGGFSAHKWASNSQKFLDTIPMDIRSNVSLHPKDATTKVLGMLWDAASDNFTFQVNLTPSTITKRNILSVIARLFDPLGLLAPILFYAKAILQKLWLLKIEWDDSPPADVIQAWTAFLADLPRVKEVSLPRWIRLVEGMPSVYGFCDASQLGYAATLYLRVASSNNTAHTFLLKAKTRLAPVKTISVPRLELCAAHLLTKLLRSIDDFIRVHNIQEVRLFSDSTIVLSWLRMVPSDMKTFVANRVGYILTHTDICQWHHVPSLENPADVASRGATTSNLLAFELWWKGPTWMRQQMVKLPPLPAVLAEVPELKQHTTTLISSLSEESLGSQVLVKFSSYRRVVATVAYIFRFLRNARSPTALTGKLMSLRAAKIYLIQETQKQYFGTDFDFATGECLSQRFKRLAVFLDTTGILRVGGRLRHAPLDYSQRHPVILPAQSRYTMLLIDHIHIKNFHLGLAALQAYLQRQFYIFQLRSLVKRRIWKCQRCLKARAKPKNPFMADLPLARVSQGRPFIRVGILCWAILSLKSSRF